MKKTLFLLSVVLRVIIVAATAIGLDMIIPFTSGHGLNYIQAHGKGVLILIGLLNIFVGAAFSAGFLSKSTSVGFSQWFMVPVKKGQWNATYGFAIVVAAINILWIILIEP